jgi:hypothetical protein
MWNYWLGGKDNFAADRDAAERVLEAMPSLPLIARAARLPPPAATWSSPTPRPTSPPKPPPRWPSPANPEHPRQLTYGREHPVVMMPMGPDHTSAPE